MGADNAIAVILPLLVVAGGAAVVLVADLFTQRKGVMAWLAAAGLVAGAAVAIGQWVSFSGGLTFHARKPQLGFAGMVSLDQYAAFCVVLFCAIGVATVMVSDSYLARRRAARGEFYALLLLIITGMIGMVMSTDIIAFFVSFELMSLPTYVLAGYLWRDERSGEASIKYFVTGAFSSAILAFGLALLYAVTGQTTYAGIAKGLTLLTASSLDARGFLVVAFVLVVTGFGFKISAVPFHSWAPDVYEGAPTPVTAFMSTGVKAAAFAGFAKLFVLAASAQWQLWVHTMTILAVVTMVVGNVLALPQRNLKRMLAYSSVAHAGYLTLGLIAAGTSGDRLGITAILFYLVTYALMNVGAFGVLIWIRNRRAFGYTLDEVAGLGRTMPWPAMFMAVLMVSLTGIPPTAGFWGKFYLFTAVIQSGLWWLAVVAVVMSAVSAYYYLRVVWFMYFREASAEAGAGATAAQAGAPVAAAGGSAAAGVVLASAGGTQGAGASLHGGSGAPVEPPAAAGRQLGQAGVVWAVGVCTFGVVAVGLFPGPLLRFSEGALRVLLGG
jgi:NADH-quinone oxidoreductase subunit N